MIPHYYVTGLAIATVISYIYLALIFEFYYRITLKKMINNIKDEFTENMKSELQSGCNESVNS